MPILDLPENFPTLTAQEVHVWHASLNFPEDELTQFTTLLSDDEEVRAKRFHFAKDRIRYTAARGILRKILSGYLHQDPKEIKFNYNSHGKPSCADNEAIQFNLSHSKNIALYAFARNLTLGIDIEYIDPDFKADAIAQRFFSASEANLLHQLTGKTKIKAFFNGWTRKEAFLKALGLGLSYSLKRVEVSMAPDQPVKFLTIDDPQQNIDQWSLYSFDQIPKYAAALVVRGKNHVIRNIEFR